jgi:hypothetical protein
MRTRARRASAGRSSCGTAQLILKNSKRAHGQTGRTIKWPTNKRERPAGRCDQGLSKKAEALAEEGDETILDLAIIGAGSRVEHYGCARLQLVSSRAPRIKCNYIDGNAKLVNLDQLCGQNHGMMTFGQMFIDACTPR